MPVPTHFAIQSRRRRRSALIDRCFLARTAGGIGHIAATYCRYHAPCRPAHSKDALRPEGVGAVAPGTVRRRRLRSEWERHARGDANTDVPEAMTMTLRALKDETALLIRMRRLLARRIGESEALLASREAFATIPLRDRTTPAVLPLRVDGSVARPLGAVGTHVPVIAGERAA